jgi:hypothetical protein
VVLPAKELRGVRCMKIRVLTMAMNLA